MKGSRSIWSGSISFGLVNIPVKLHSAVKEDRIDFALLSKENLAPIQYARIDSHTGEEVAYEDIVKGFQYAKGKYITVTDEDFEKARPNMQKFIDILQFVKEDEIDSLYFDKPYYLIPVKGSEKAYKLLLKSMDETKTAGIAEFMMRNRVHLCALRNSTGILLLNQLRYHETVLPLPEINTKRARITPKEIQLATKLIAQLTDAFDPTSFKDNYNAALKKIIKAKAAGKDIRIAEPQKQSSESKVLMEMLKESLSVKRNRA